MHLVYIDSRSEQEFLVNTMQRGNTSWIGLSSLVWLDGSGLSYSDFGRGAFDDGGHCFRIKDSDGRWYDRSCSFPYRFICEKQGEVGPDCGPSDLRFSHSCYVFHETKSTFSSAKLSCESVPGRHLVFIGSNEEQEFLEANLPNDGEGYWIGLSSVTWTDGSGLTYNNFGGPYISCFNNDGDKFRLVEGSREWHDWWNDYFLFICERDLPCSGTLMNGVEQNGSCYFFSDVKWDFFQADNFCKYHEMNLVSIGSQEEQDFLVTHLDDNEDYWIGLNGISWLDGTSLVYNKFPYNGSVFDDEGRCFFMHPTDLPWYDESCSASSHYVCEKEIGETSTDGGPVQTSDLPSSKGIGRSMSIKLVADDSILKERHVLASHRVSSVSRCARQCLAEECCSCFTFIEQERACLLAVACETDAECSGNGYIVHNGSCYFFSNIQSNFKTSNLFCKDHGMHLVSIQSSDEQAFLVKEITKRSTEDYWIGLSGFSWLNGSRLSYINFPAINKALDDGGRCFRLRANKNNWHDDTCSDQFKFICEVECDCPHLMGELPDYMYMHDQSCYYFSPLADDFNASKSRCEGLGMHLVYIESEDEEQFLVSNRENGADYWIGLARVGWLDRSQITYNKFQELQSTFDSGGSCFRLRHPEFDWHESTCGSTHPYICEKAFDGQAHMLSTSFKLVADDATLDDEAIISSYSVRSV
ncbi:macrophage mannose receptor 1-like [Lytechinus variegatus]|uniref:macrophage mannose receptor 1-like n=1 Tax=Lytechinus variegatus TaxID=7654 RepID=UPI001BB260E9|nr:macrophage mannose receptor 1-like [Lytechinus variegatus]